MRWWRVAVVISVVLIAVGQGGGRKIAFASSLTVCSSGCPYTTIGAALNVAAAGDTISIGAGTYAERLVISSPVTLQADPTLPTVSGATGVVIDGGGLGTVITISAGISATLTNLTVQNGFGTDGGGIDNQGYLYLIGDTITGNQSATGAGIFTHGPLTLTNSTIAQNGLAAGFNVYGGGIYALPNPALSYGGVSITNSTIAHNSLTASAGSTASGGGIYESGTTVQLVNTIVAQNTATNGPDCFGTMTSLGHNLISDGSGCSGFFSASGDQVGTSASPIDPHLGPLQDNGGGTRSMTLLPGSPAIDAGADNYCPSADQLGAPRPQGVHCDIGAIELQSQLNVGPLPTGLSFTTCVSASSPCSHIASAIGRGLPGGTVAIAAGTYVENVTLDRDLTLTGAGSSSTIIDGNQSGTVVTINRGVTASITQVTIQHGRTPGDGGGIADHGTLTLATSVVSGNFASGNGGGIASDSTGTVAISNSVISQNYSGDGGGIYDVTLSLLSITASTITANTGFVGGGIYTAGNLVVQSSTIDHNTSMTTGGGIEMDGGNGVVQVTNSTIADNTADSQAGISASNGGLTLTSDTVSGNTATTGAGGGVAASATPSSPLVVGNTIIAGNSAGTDADCDGSLTSSGHNLVGVLTSDCTGIGNRFNGDTTGTSSSPFDPMLGPLQNNGGSTQTMALLKGSPAVGAGDASLCSAVNDQDQRGDPRHSATRLTCDVGAYDTGQDVQLFWQELVRKIPVSQPHVLTLGAVNAVDGTLARGYSGTVHFAFSGVSVDPFPDFTFTPQAGGIETLGSFVPHDVGSLTVQATDTVVPSRSTSVSFQVGLPVSSGWNLIDLPLQTTGVTSMSALVTSLTGYAQLGSGAVAAAATYANGRFSVYVPGYSTDQPLVPNQGIFLDSTRSGVWAPVGGSYLSGVGLSLDRGWNLVAAPYPPGGLHASTIASEVKACNVQEIAGYSGGSYQVWTPNSGTDFVVPTYSGAWIECTGQGSWTPS